MITRNQVQLARFQKTKLARIQRFDSFDIFLWHYFPILCSPKQQYHG